MTFLFVQNQPTSISGAGVVAGATTIVLSSFKQIDGTFLTMANFGAKGFGTLEPGNGTLEEQISFTGITQNANGTATLTGVSTVLMVSPYTETSGLAQTHAGATSFIISNTSGFYNKLLAKDDNATITGKYVFPNDDISNAGIASDTDTAVATAFVTLGQLSRQAISGASDASTTVKGIVQLPTQAQVDARTTTGSTAALLALTPDKQRSVLLSDYATDTGAADAYAIAPSPAITALVAGTRVSFKVAHTNTTTSTIVVNALTGTAIFKNDGATALVAGDLVAGQVVELEHNGINGFMLMTPPVKGLVPLQTSNAGKFLTTSGTVASWDYPYDYQAFTTVGAGNTWTKPSNLVGTELVIVQMWGAGAGGGGVAAGGGSNGGGGGGGGAFVERHFRASDLGGTVTVTIGAGGTGGAAGANNGTAGGSTTFGALATAYGGGLGTSGTASGGTNGAGGGGGGNNAVGSNAATTTGGTGGTFGGGVHAAATSNDSGGGGGGSDGEAGGASANGGGGGGGGGSGHVGGASFNGGGGGGSGTSGGTSLYGGAGGAGGNSVASSPGSAPAGGGGGAITSGNTGLSYAGGDGARGECRVWVIK